ncbi:FKBP8 [Lepeophtheirus salmonis]|uniref:peptidylprolyl isomerase n=1 Tax=Lepeophtheirus salmonis TaxID=72036 RepID=A0A7R8CJI9_LEPSM|nr:peptidyl-prolyl cis-trans isomerase FKBP8-like [Lepeophtheirus salmonis]CAB4058783.1 FKBP8 [Lepeophtheirus salmonis]CAF2839137.1 FKBP8 [Lepeophtheirus salmonis]
MSSASSPISSQPLTSGIENLNLECGGSTTETKPKKQTHSKNLGAIPKSYSCSAVSSTPPTTPRTKKKRRSNAIKNKPIGISKVASYSTPELIRKPHVLPQTDYSMSCLLPPEPIPDLGRFNSLLNSPLPRRDKRRSCSENKENSTSAFSSFGEINFEDENTDEDADDLNIAAMPVESGSRPKLIWKSLTKSGSIKKCILVDGIVDGGRPKVGDIVLVKCQGKLKDGRVIDDYPNLVFHVGDYEVVEGLDLAVQSMFKNELSIISVKPDMAYGNYGRKHDVPAGARMTYLFGLLHFEKEKDIKCLTWAQRRKSGQSRMRLANWWYQRKEYPIAVKCYKKALQFYNDIPTNQECSNPEEYKELLQLMEERLRVMRQVANIFKRIANLIQSGQINS